MTGQQQGAAPESAPEQPEVTPTVETKAAGAPPPANNNEQPQGDLSRTFKNVAGIAICGSLLTTGIGMFINGAIFDQSLLAQTIDTASLFTSSMVVWSLAMGAGALGHKLGEQFEPAENTGAQWRARSAAVGLTLIAAAFLFPVGERVHDAVHDGLTGTFDSTEENAPMEPKANMLQAPQLEYRLG